jgi:hypothetical protein
MKVVFDSEAIFDDKAQAVKFAGLVLDGRSRGRLVICRVPRDTLAKRFNLSECNAALLLQRYEAVKTEFHDIALQKAMLGDYHPVILAEEIAVHVPIRCTPGIRNSASLPALESDRG